MMLHRQWNVGFLNSVFMKDVITLGVGWQNYQGKPDFYTKTLLKRLLSRELSSFSKGQLYFRNAAGYQMLLIHHARRCGILQKALCSNSIL